MSAASFSAAVVAAREAGERAGLRPEVYEPLIGEVEALVQAYGDTLPREVAERIGAKALAGIVRVCDRFAELPAAVVGDTEHALARARQEFEDRAASRRAARS